MAKLQHSIHVLLFFTLTFAGLYFAAPFLIPITLAAVLAMLFLRFCNWLEHKGMPRAVASLLCVLSFVLAVAVVVFLLSWQLNGLMENIGAMKQRATDLFSNLQHWITEQIGLDPKGQQQLIKKPTQEAGSSAGNLLAGIASKIMDIVLNTVLVLVYLFLFLFYRSHLKKFALKLVPMEQRSKTSTAVHQAAEVAQHYLGGLAAMIVTLWGLYGIGFSIVGVENALFFAVLCGILEIIPFVGNLTGTSVTLLAVLAQGGPTKMVIGVLVTYAVIQFVQTYLLEPLIVGEQVNINPLFTVLVIVLSEMIWGVAGMVLAIPLLGMVKIICDLVPALQPYGFLIGTEKQGRRKTGFIDKIKATFRK